MSYFNIPVKTITNTYLVTVHTADCTKYEYLINANSAREAQSIGFRKTSDYLRNMGIKFYPTKITAYAQGFKMI